MKHLDSAAVTRSAIDFIFVSVLLDAGAGDQWQYKDPVSKRTLNRSEGLAAASMDFSSTISLNLIPIESLVLQLTSYSNAPSKYWHRRFSMTAIILLLGLLVVQNCYVD